MSREKQAKTIRREVDNAVRAQAKTVRDEVANDIIMRMYLMPLRLRAKWAWSILLGYQRESLWMMRTIWMLDWALERLMRWGGDLLWPPKTCGTCVLGYEGTCQHCAGDNYGHTTEIWSKSPACANWQE